MERLTVTSASCERGIGERSLSLPLPASPLGAYIKSLPRSLPNRLPIAKALAHDPTELVAAFDETVSSYWGYDNLRPFSPGGAGTYLPGCEKTEQVAAALERAPVDGWEVAGAPRLSFVYLDREIVPAAGHTRSSVIKADVVLAAKKQNRPIIGEIKTPTDTHAFGAVLQGLHAAAQLAGPYQRARLRLWCSNRRYVLGDKIPDVYVLLVNHPTTGTKPKLLQAAVQLRNELSKHHKITERVHQIAFLHISCDRTGLITGISAET